MQLKFYYFPMPYWRAEMSRLSLHLGNVPFENMDVTRDSFMAMKQGGELPYGQLPMLEIDGQKLAQSAAIARFCGKLGGFYPKDDALLAARIDEVLDTANDIASLLSPSMRESDEAKKAEMRAELANEVLPRWFGFLEARLAQNGKNGCFAGSSWSIADFAVWRLVGWLTSGVLDGIPTTLADAFPLLSAHGKDLSADPRIQAWMEQYKKAA